MKRSRRGHQSALADPSSAHRERENRGRKGAIAMLAKLVRWLIAFGAWILPALFLWLQVKNYEFVLAIDAVQPYVIMQGLLVVYYLCWVAGTRFDVTTQESIYRAKYSFPWMQFGAGIVMIAAGAALLWASADDKKFAAVLSIFVAINVGAWVLLKQTVSGIIRDTRDVYAKERNFYEIAKLDIVADYILGNWQWWRFAGMAVIVLVGDAICFFDSVRSSVSVALAPLSHGLSPQKISPLLPQMGFALFLVFAEGWIWFKRAVTRATMYALDRLSTEYDLMQR